MAAASPAACGAHRGLQCLRGGWVRPCDAVLVLGHVVRAAACNQTLMARRGSTRAWMCGCVDAGAWPPRTPLAALRRPFRARPSTSPYPTHVQHDGDKLLLLTASGSLSMHALVGWPAPAGHSNDHPSSYRETAMRVEAEDRTAHMRLEPGEPWPCRDWVRCGWWGACSTAGASGEARESGGRASTHRAGAGVAAETSDAGGDGGAAAECPDAAEPRHGHSQPEREMLIAHRVWGNADLRPYVTTVVFTPRMVVHDGLDNLIRIIFF